MTRSMVKLPFLFYKYSHMYLLQRLAVTPPSRSSTPRVKNLPRYDSL